MRYLVRHVTEYAYDHAVSLSHHVVHLTPREMPTQRCLAHRLEVRPQPAVLARRRDYFGNELGFLTVEGAHGEFSVVAESRIELTPRQAPNPERTPAWERVVDGAREALGLTLEAAEYGLDSPLVRRHAAFADYARRAFAPGRPLLDAALALSAGIHADFTFDPKATTVSTPPHEVLRRRRGVCQDFAHLALACLRSVGLPARYVSGYLETQPPPGQPKLQGADASHAWVALLCPGLGWIDLDPTNNLIPSDRHLTLAWGRDYSDVSPIRGILVGGGAHRVRVAVDVASEPNSPEPDADESPPRPGG